MSWNIFLKWKSNHEAKKNWISEGSASSLMRNKPRKKYDEINHKVTPVKCISQENIVSKEKEWIIRKFEKSCNTWAISWLNLYLILKRCNLQLGRYLITWYFCNLGKIFKTKQLLDEYPTTCSKPWWPWLFPELWHV